MTDPAHGGRAVGVEPSGQARATAPPPHHPSAEVRRRACHTGRCPREARRGRPKTPFALLAMLLAALALAGSACGTASTAANDDARELNVFAAASLTEAFTRLGGQYTAAHPGVKVTLDFAGSNDLVTQLRQGAPADVLATADTTNMDKAAGLTGQPLAFAANKLVIAVEPGDPKHITGLADLARKDLKVVLAAPEVPAGKYAAEILTGAGATVQPVSLEVSVKGVVTKVSLGEADAGIVYVTDIDAAQGKVEGVAIPDDQNVIATYPIATLDEATSQDDAQAFVDLVLSAQGQKVLAEYGFLPAP